MDNAQQQIVDSITSSSNILVAVSSDPNVDELSAALGLTLILDKLDKRATAIFSGGIPPAISFLEPEKTFDNTADSLRDFIIALNKEKADHLRYKVDGDVVKIFITPYKTKLSETDLEFSQGDYNVEMVLALGVKDQDHLDKALDAHGKILHDAKVMTITAGPDNGSNLGSADWHNDSASSLSEMVVSLVNAMKSSEPLLDQQTSTALLTGIVSATDRFSNDKTSSQVMTLAAQLMAAGANQQLIAAKLQEGNDLAPAPIATSSSNDGDSVSTDGTELTIDRTESHDSAPTAGDRVIEPPVAEEAPSTPVISTEESDQLELEKQLAGLTTPPTGTMADIEKELQEAVAPTNETPVDDAVMPTVPSDTAMPDFEPAPAPSALPGATPEITHDHTPVGILPPDQMPAMNGTMAGDVEEPTVDPFNEPPQGSTQQDTAIDIDGGSGTPEGAAILSTPPSPVAPILPPMPDPVVVETPQQAAPAQPELQIPDLPPLPPLPPLPIDGSVPPLPPPPPPPIFSGQDAGAMPAGAVSGDIFGDTSIAQPPAAPAPPSPGQFKIPGQ